MKLSVIVPCYNEEKTVRTMLNRLVKVKEIYEIIVVDDNSQDESVKLAKKVADKRLYLYKHPINRGKGAAVLTGLAQATGDYLVIQDADLEYDPTEIPRLLEPFKLGKAEVVYGSRFLGPRTNMFYWHYVGNRFLNFVINIFYNSILTDMETCYKVIPTKLMRSLKLKENDFRIEPEITCKLLNRKIKIMEVPISFAARTYEEGKKITWRDGFLALWVIMRIRIVGN